jgi:hypothetical protein
MRLVDKISWDMIMQDVWVVLLLLGVLNQVQQSHPAHTVTVTTYSRVVHTVNHVTIPIFVRGTVAEWPIQRISMQNSQRIKLHVSGIPMLLSRVHDDVVEQSGHSRLCVSAGTVLNGDHVDGARPVRVSRAGVVVNGDHVTGASMGSSSSPFMADLRTLVNGDHVPSICIALYV